LCVFHVVVILTSIMSDQPSNLSCSQPLDLSTNQGLKRTENQFPSAADFAFGGRFEHLHVPFFAPAPLEILKYLYGNDVIHHDQVKFSEQNDILRRIHEDVLKTGLYCDCGMHLLKGPTDYSG
jgi:hypothetical protein